MGYYNEDVLDRSLQSYGDAAKQAMKVAGGPVVFGASGYTTILTDHFRPQSMPPFNKVARFINRQFVKRTELFKGGHPQIIQPTYWGYEKFFVVQFDAVFDYHDYEFEPEQVWLNEDGSEARREPERVRDRKQHIVLHLHEFSAGLKDWAERKKHLIELSSDLTGEEGVKLRAAIKSADDERTRWIEALKDIGGLVAGMGE